MRDTITETVVYVGPHYELRFDKTSKPEDLDDDCLVTVVDIMQVAAQWGTADPLADVNDDGTVDVADVQQVAGAWRQTCHMLAETVKYYALGGRRVAMRKAGTLYYLFADHLGSTSVAYDATTGQTQTIRYYPWGQVRAGDVSTDRRFTGQRWDGTIGLYDYNARWYEPALGRFVQPDTIVPEPGNPQSLNRYSYVLNNPLTYTDPSGYCIPEDCPGVPQAAYPTNPESLRNEEYAAWLVEVLLWLEREQAGTGGMAWIEHTRQGVAAELAPFLMKDPRVLDEVLYQQVMGAMPQLSAQVAGAGTEIMLSKAGWVLGMVRRASRLSLPETIRGTRISWPSAPHNPRGGHWDVIVQRVQEMAQSGEYTEIYVNKAISTATGGQVQSRLRPDIIGVRRSGTYDVFEVKSPSQSLEQLQRKVEYMESNLFGALMVKGEVIKP